MPQPDLPSLIRAASFHVGSTERRRLQRDVRSGELVRLRDGVFVAASPWAGLAASEQFLLAIRAATLKTEPRLVVSHAAALAVHGISFLHPWPAFVDLTDPDGGRGQIRTGLHKHEGPLDDGEVEIVDGLRVTSLPRTCIDIARTRPFEVAVAAVDECLHKGAVSENELVASLATTPWERGRALVERVLRFSNGLSDSGGESWCRCLLRDLGAPAPVQQKEFRDQSGRIAFVDFWFESCGVVVEFDGDQKYLQPRFSKGRTTSEILLDERKRERRLLALSEVQDVVRVEWADLRASWRLRALAASAGVPLG